MKRINSFGIPGVICLLFSNIVSAQNYVRSFGKNLTPSPTVASLDAFGGVEVEKSTGGLSKTIGLFTAKEGDIEYSPAIHYFSTGIKVNDWGSRVGIAWSENTTPIISRTVRGVPDERATSRIGDTRYEFGDPGAPDFTQQTYDKVRQLEVSGTTFDGQYDLFNFSIFGVSGQFIIKNNQAILLSDDKSFKIDIVQISPGYLFVLTDNKGVKYYFNGLTEETKFDSENLCDVDNPYRYGGIMTAWFIDKIVSQTGYIVNFNYDYAEYKYIYDYDESFLFNYFSYPDWYYFTGLDPYGEKLACLRRKITKTYILNSVVGDNFSVGFEYINRNDIYGEKLLRKITITNTTGVLRECEFLYDEVVATSTFEPGLSSLLGNNDPSELNGLKTRYFLTDLNILNGQGGIEQEYKFDYISPSSLAHRFSFSQDYMGCYNAKANSSMVPTQATNGLESILPVSSITFGDRRPSASGSAGLLNRILYPTSGKDSIVYEQNQYKTIVENVHHASYTDWYGTGESNTYDGWFFTMWVPREGDVELVLECYYDGDDPPGNDEDEYFAQIQLWNTNGRMNFPNGTNEIDLRLGQTYYSTEYNYLVKGNVVRLHFTPDDEYNLYLKLLGKHTTVRATLHYIEDITHDRIDSTYAGHRIKKVITSSGIAPDIVKLYNYNAFQKKGDTLKYADSSSLVCVPMKNYSVLSYGQTQYTIPNTWPNMPPGNSDLNGYISYSIFRLLSSSNYNINIYGGLPYAYRNVTEFQDSTKTSFIASEFNLAANSRSYRELVDLYPRMDVLKPDLENSAWDHGLELQRYYGTKLDDEYVIDLEKKWNYSVTDNTYYNYASYLLHPIYTYSSNPQANIANYIVTSNITYTHWKRLDSLVETSYFRYPGGYNTISSRSIYRYNIGDRLVEEEETESSKKEILLKSVARPYKMVTTGRDPNGIYQGMINNHILSPEIEVVNKRSSSQINLVRTNYFQPFTGLYVPESIQTQKRTSDPLVTELKFNQYDAKGNVLSLSRENDVTINYLWGYKSRYPVAKVVGSDYATISSVVSQSQIDNATGNDLNLRAVLNTLRTDTRTKTSLTNTYTYIPLIGATSETDAKGQTVYYEYDSLGRLKLIKDQHGKILKQYDYQYQKPITQ